ncbi:hypothetical protein WJX72_003990 [[Myrmecia] bisecta]|uniref:DUF4200 domain-containing protein n=1 Tax=[Myrmecia] bisecta TaxID=41462 RepID=A0AAW1QQ01_9CHLO
MESSQFLSTVQRKKMVPHTLVLEHVSPATRLLEKRRQMFEVQEALEQQKQEFHRKEEVFKRREEGLKKKDLELQESLIRFSKFLQENDSKRMRALKKAQDERKTREEKEREVEQLMKLMDELRVQKDEVQEILNKNLKYQHYLEAVLETADEFHEIGDLMSRHATLEATNDDLKEQQNQAAELAEQTRSDLVAYTKAKTDEILNLNNMISRLKKELESYEQESYAQEAKKDYSLQVASQKTLEYGQVCMSTDNLFHRCRQRSKVAHANETNPLAQLDVIGNFVSDLGTIIKQQVKAGTMPGGVPSSMTQRLDKMQLQ